MVTFSFTVGSADDARTAAEVCDFLAEQMTNPTRRRRSSKASEAVNTVQMPNDNPPVVSDPAALYAALSGTASVEQPVTAVAEQPVTEATETPVVAETREQRIEKTRDAVKARGGKWLGDYFKVHNPAGKKLSDHTDEELAALHAAAVSGA